MLHATTRFVTSKKQAQLYSKALNREVKVGEAIEMESKPVEKKIKKQDVYMSL